MLEGEPHMISDFKHSRSAETDSEAIDCGPSDTVDSAFPQFEINEEQGLERFQIGQKDRASASVELVTIGVIMLASVISAFVAFQRLFG